MKTYTIYTQEIKLHNNTHYTHTHKLLNIQIYKDATTFQQQHKVAVNCSDIKILNLCLKMLKKKHNNKHIKKKQVRILP